MYNQPCRCTPQILDRHYQAPSPQEADISSGKAVQSDTNVPLPLLHRVVPHLQTCASSQGRREGGRAQRAGQYVGSAADRAVPPLISL